MFYVEHYFLSNSLQLADALIAATSVIHCLKLTSGNLKHYSILREVQLQKFIHDPNI